VSDWVELVRLASPAEAHILAGRLQSAGIEVHIEGGGFSSLLPGLDSAGFGTRLLVLQDQLELARIVAEGDEGCSADCCGD